MQQAVKGILFFVAVAAVLTIVAGTYFGDILTPQGGFFISLDKGATWRKFGTLATGGNINRLDVIDIKNNPKDPRILYAATLNNGVLKSVDGGEVWHKLEDKNGVLKPRADVQSVAVDPSRPDYGKKIPDRFYLAVFQDDYGRVLKTEDGGLSFKEVYITPKPNYSVFAVEVDPKNSKIIWAGTGEGILLKSADYGETWRLAQEFGQAINYVLINPKNTSQMLVTSFNGGVFSSVDGGTNWVDETEGLNSFNGARNIQSLIYYSDTSETYMATGFGLLKSRNFGIDWVGVEALFPQESLPVLDAALVNKGREIYASANNLIYSTKDGGKFWQVRKLGTAKKLRALWVDPKNDSRIIAGASKAGRQ